MGFARHFLYVQTWLMLLGVSPRGAEWRKLEITALFGYYTWLSYMLSFCLSWKMVLFSLIVSHFLAGILHI